MLKFRLLDILNDDEFKSALPFIQNYLNKNHDTELVIDSFQNVEDLITQGTQQLKILNYNLVRVGLEISPGILKNFAGTSPLIRQIQCCDYFEKEKSNENWWPRVLWYENLRQVLVHDARSINNRLEAFVLSRGPMLRMLIALLQDLGFKKINIICEDEHSISQELNEYKQNLLGIQIQTVNIQEIVLRTPNGSILINGLFHHEVSSMINDIRYFNFLVPQSVFVDCFMFNGSSELVFEAERAKFKVFDGSHIICRREFEFLTLIGALKNWHWDDFQDQWKIHFKK